MVSSLSLSSTLGDSWGLWIGALATAVLFVVLYYRPLRALRRVRGRAPASNGKAGGGGPGSRGGCEDAIFPYGVTELRGRRPYMEDRHAVAGRSATGHPDISLFCVFDGHGGAGASQFCKDTLTRNVVGSVGFPNAPKQALSNGFLRTDDDYLQIAQTNGREDGVSFLSVIAVAQRRSAPPHATRVRPARKRTCYDCFTLLPAAHFLPSVDAPLLPAFLGVD